MGRRAERVDPALELGARRRLDHVGRVDANVEAHDEHGRHGACAVFWPPLFEMLARRVRRPRARQMMLLVQVQPPDIRHRRRLLLRVIAGAGVLALKAPAHVRREGKRLKPAALHPALGRGRRLVRRGRGRRLRSRRRWHRRCSNQINRALGSRYVPLTAGVQRDFRDGIFRPNPRFGLNCCGRFGRHCCGPQHALVPRCVLRQRFELNTRSS